MRPGGSLLLWAGPRRRIDHRLGSSRGRHAHCRRSRRLALKSHPSRQSHRGWLVRQPLSRRRYSATNSTTVAGSDLDPASDCRQTPYDVAYARNTSMVNTALTPAQPTTIGTADSNSSAKAARPLVASLNVSSSLAGRLTADLARHLRTPLYRGRLPTCVLAVLATPASSIAGRLPSASDSLGRRMRRVSCQPFLLCILDPQHELVRAKGVMPSSSEPVPLAMSAFARATASLCPIPTRQLAAAHALR